MISFYSNGDQEKIKVRGRLLDLADQNYLKDVNVKLTYPAYVSLNSFFNIDFQSCPDQVLVTDINGEFQTEIPVMKKNLPYDALFVF